MIHNPTPHKVGKINLGELIKRGLLSNSQHIRAVYVDYNFLSTSYIRESKIDEDGKYYSWTTHVQEREIYNFDLNKFYTLKQICNDYPDLLDYEVMEFKRTDKILYLKSKRGSYTINGGL